MKNKLFFIILCILILCVCCNKTKIEENYDYYIKNYDGTYDLKNINTSNLPTDFLPKYKKYILSNSNEVIISYDPFGNVYCLDNVKNNLIQKSVYFSNMGEPLTVVFYEYANKKLKKRIVETLNYGIKEEINNNDYSIDFWTRRVNMKSQKKEKFGIKFIKDINQKDFFKMSGVFGFTDEKEMEIVYSEKKYENKITENGNISTTKFKNLTNNTEVSYVVDEYRTDKNEKYMVITDQASSKEINRYFEKNTEKYSVLGKVINDDDFVEVSKFKKEKKDGIMIIYDKNDEEKINQIIFPDLSLSYVKDMIYIAINIDIQRKPVYLVNYIPTEKVHYRLGKYSIGEKKYMKTDLSKKAIDKNNDKFYFFIKQADIENLKENKLLK